MTWKTWLLRSQLPLLEAVIWGLQIFFDDILTETSWIRLILVLSIEPKSPLVTAIESTCHDDSVLFFFIQMIYQLYVSSMLGSIHLRPYRNFDLVRAHRNHHCSSLLGQPCPFIRILFHRYIGACPTSLLGLLGLVLSSFFFSFQSCASSLVLVLQFPSLS